MPSRASRTTKPCPPPAVRCGGRVAMRHVGRPVGDRRHEHAEVGGAGLEVAVDEEQVPRLPDPAGSAWSCSATSPAPVVIAAALPRLRACRTTSAPAARARSAVSSVLPSSTTTTRSTPGMAGGGGDGRRDPVRLVLGRDDGGDGPGGDVHAGQRRVIWRLSRPGAGPPLVRR